VFIASAALVVSKSIAAADALVHATRSPVAATRPVRHLPTRAFLFGIRIDSIRFVMRIDSNLFVL